MERKQVFTLALVDIDHFKKINDTYGHPAGDAVLKEVAGRLRIQDESCLLVARYGGEEFAILFTAPLNTAASKMESIRTMIQDKSVSAEGHTIQVTISVGVSEITADDRIAKIVRRSDEALYSAKMSGRNRVFVHTGKLCEVFGNPGPARHATAAMAHASAGVGGFDADSGKESLQLQLLNQLDEFACGRKAKISESQLGIPFLRQKEDETGLSPRTCSLPDVFGTSKFACVSVGRLGRELKRELHLCQSGNYYFHRSS